VFPEKTNLVLVSKASKFLPFLPLGRELTTKYLEHANARNTWDPIMSTISSLLWKHLVFVVTLKRQMLSTETPIMLLLFHILIVKINSFKERENIIYIEDRH
jgi:hypothetical protein